MTQSKSRALALAILLIGIAGGAALGAERSRDDARNRTAAHLRIDNDSRAGSNRGYANGTNTSPLDPARVDFVVGNLQFTLFHELAHVAILDLEVPIIGPEEQAADYIATMSLIRPLQVPPVGTEKLLEFAMTAANAFGILWQIGEEHGASLPYWDSHGLSIQRFYSIGCLLYGSDPQRFAKIPERIQMPAQRAASCEEEYATAGKSLDWLRGFAENTHRHQQRPVSR